jgi:hypothetical protein
LGAINPIKQGSILQAMSQILSSIGAALILWAYAALHFKKMSHDGTLYGLLNLVGSSLLALVAGIEGLWAYVVLNSVWAIVSLRPLLSGRATAT